jgi:hypothetical protein
MVVHYERANRSQPPHHYQEDYGEGQGVPKFHKLSFLLYDDKEDPLG